MRRTAGTRSSQPALADIAAATRHEAWLHRSWPNFAPLYHTTPLFPFDANGEVTQFGSLTFAFADITGQRWERSPDLLRLNPNDSMAVNISLDIGAHGRAGDRIINQVPGGALLVDLSQMAVHESSSGRSAQLIISRAMATGAGLDVSELHGLVLSPGATAMLGSHMLHLRNVMPHMSDADGVLAARSLLDILVLAINTTGRADAAAARSAASTAALRARHEIRQNLGSPSLTVANLCRRLQLSRSTLHRLFEDEGGVQAHIRNARLDAAQQALRQSDKDELISVIAERLGFSDAAHFSRSFRARFGESPSDFRARIIGD